MGNNRIYQIEIKPISAKPLQDVDEISTIEFQVKNLGKDTFPGKEITIGVHRSNFPGLRVGSPIIIPELEPKTKKKVSIVERPLVAGAIVFTILFPLTNEGKVRNYEVNGIPIRFYLDDGRELAHAQAIHAVRVKSQEEAHALSANIIATGALILLVLFQMLDWIINYYMKYH